MLTYLSTVIALPPVVVKTMYNAFFFCVSDASASIIRKKTLSFRLPIGP